MLMKMENLLCPDYLCLASLLKFASSQNQSEDPCTDLHFFLGVLQKARLCLRKLIQIKDRQ